ncbi:hypothetical protein ACFLQJ_01755 [Calditrichota bacterium]
MIKSAYLARPGNEPLSTTLAIQLLVVVAFFVFIGIWRTPALAFAGIGILVFLVTAGWRVETFPILFLLYISVSTGAYLDQALKFFNIIYYPHLAPVLIAGMFVVIIINKSMNFIKLGDINNSNNKSTGRDVVGILLILFLIWMVFESIRGNAIGNNPRWIRFEIFYTFPLVGYFVWREVFKIKSNINNWFIIFIIIELITSVQYFTLITINWEDILSFVLLRIVTRQGHLILVAIPIVMAFIFSSRTTRIRLLWILCLLIILAHMLSTQQRVLFIAAGFEFVLMLTFFAFKDGWTKKGFIIWLSGMTLFSLSIISAVLYVLSVFNIDIEMLLSRWDRFGTLKDASTMMRIFDIREALEQYSTSPLLGCGIGKTVLSIPSGFHFFYIDNSYIVALLKGGPVYLLLLVAIYLSGAWFAFIVYLKSTDIRTKMTGAGIVVALVGIMFTGATNVCLIYYRYTFLWMMIIAAAVSLYESLKNDTGTIDG